MNLPLLRLLQSNFDIRKDKRYLYGTQWPATTLARLLLGRSLQDCALSVPCSVALSPAAVYPLCVVAGCFTDHVEMQALDPAAHPWQQRTHLEGRYGR